MSAPLKKDFFRGSRFVPVGIATTLVDGLVVGWLLWLWGREYAVCAGVAGWACGYTLNFFGHKILTFFNLERSGWEPWRQFLLHFSLKFINLGLRLLALQVFVVMFEWEWGLLVLVLIPFWNYLANRWIFAHESPLQFFRMLRLETPGVLRSIRGRCRGTAF